MSLVDAKAEPEWRIQSPSPRYAWIDFRAAATGDPPPSVRKRTTVRRWEVPLQRGTATAVVAGVVDWVSAERSGRAGAR